MNTSAKIDAAITSEDIGNDRKNELLSKVRRVTSTSRRRIKLRSLADFSSILPITNILCNSALHDIREDSESSPLVA